MSGDLEPPGFGGDQGVFVGLGGGQGAGRIQIHQIIIIIEHAFNIRRITDTFPTKRHPGDRRTTPGRSGQHSSAIVVPMLPFPKIVTLVEDWALCGSGTPPKISEISPDRHRNRAADIN
jgi:hypothetical protein